MTDTRSMDPFDYASYSLDELLDARRNINEDQFPERVLQLDIEIKNRKQQIVEDPSIEARPPTPLWPLLVVGGVIVAIVGLALVLVVPGKLAESKRLSNLKGVLAETHPQSTDFDVKLMAYSPEGEKRGPKEASKADDVKQSEKKAEGGKSRGPNKQLVVSFVNPEVLGLKYEEKREFALAIAQESFEQWEDKETLGQIRVEILEKRREPAAPGNKFAFEKKDLKPSVDVVSPDGLGAEAG